MIIVQSFTVVKKLENLVVDPNYLKKYGKSFVTHNDTSAWRRELTKSDLVGRALLASGWAFHGLA